MPERDRRKLQVRAQDRQRIALTQRTRQTRFGASAAQLAAAAGEIGVAQRCAQLSGEAIRARERDRELAPRAAIGGFRRDLLERSERRHRNLPSPPKRRADWRHVRARRPSASSVRAAYSRRRARVALASLSCDHRNRDRRAPAARAGCVRRCRRARGTLSIDVAARAMRTVQQVFDIESAPA